MRIHRFRWGALLAGVLALSLFVAACGRKPADQGAAPAPEGPKRGGILKVGAVADAVGFDPHLVSAYSSAIVIEQLYNSLLRLDETNQVKPELAEDWDVSDDGLTYTFYLRKGVKFHNGREMTAEDVKYSYERIMDKKVGSPQAYLFEPVERIEAPDRYTVRIVLKRPHAPLLNSLAGILTAIVPKETVEANGDLQNVADGTGPFKLKEYVPATKIVLERNPDYWEEGLPYLDGIEWIPMPDDTARLTALRTGEVDFIEGVPQKDVATLRSDPNVVLVGGPGTWYDYIGINHQKEIFQNPKVRQAMAWAVDREAIIQTALFGEGTAIKSGPVPPGHWAYSDYNPYPKPDLEKAKQLLREAGYPDGFRTTIKVGADYKSQVAIAQVVQSQLKQIGIEAEVVPMEWGLFIDEVLNKGTWDLVILGWIGFVDPDDYFYAPFHTGEKWNYIKYSDPELDALLEQARAETDQDQRKALYLEIQKQLADKAPYVFLHINNQYEGIRPDVKGYVHYATGSFITFRQVWLDRTTQ